jgi:cell division protein FtsN
MNTPKGEKIRLRVGPFATRAEAEKARDALKSSGMAGIVVAR